MKLRALVGGSAEVTGPEVTLREAAGAMMAAGVGSLGVVDGRDLVGILTERDLVRAVSDDADLSSATVQDWMTEAPDVFSPEVDVEEASQWLLETGYRHLPVIDAAGELLGIASIRDLLWAIVEGD
ncbi:MAG: CBS domain-containing protein [Actinomycetota bacterium]|nr:CBS domain-containing protein [Actinomycetota bacterium]